MNRKQKKRHWYQSHIRDPYVRLAQKCAYRSRAAFKLCQLDDRFGFLKQARVVVDLGAAPGSWTQVVMQRCGTQGNVMVVALDRVEMAPLSGVHCLQGDFTDERVVQRLVNSLEGRRVDVVLSDLSPDLSGIRVVDQMRVVALGEAVLDFAQQVLAAKGILVVKLFEGAGMAEFRQQMKTVFSKLDTVKPSASRDHSSEIYMVGCRP